MAQFSGKASSAKFGTLAAETDLDNPQSWSVDISRNAVDVDVCSVDAIVSLPLHYSWTASVNCVLDSATELGAHCADETAAANLIITAEAGHTFTGTAINTGTSISGSVDSYVEVVHTFQSAGTMTQAV